MNTMTTTMMMLMLLVMFISISMSMTTIAYFTSIANVSAFAMLSISLVVLWA